MGKYNANITFTGRRQYTRLALLAALKGKTLGGTVKELIATELKRLRTKIGALEDK